MIKVGVFEDHPIVSSSLESQFKANGIETVFNASQKEVFYAQLKALHHQLEILIIDMLAADVRGLEVYEYVCKNYANLKVISFTTLSSPVLVENLISIGVKGYVNKSQPESDLITAIRKVAAGRMYVPPDYDFLLKKSGVSDSITLSEREIQILQLVASEFTTNDIAQQLGISVNTVENHRKRIFAKLQVKNVAGMVREAVKLGYIN
jgi:DNA-binding NarL/FixJ family response regulator